LRRHGTKSGEERSHYFRGLESDNFPLHGRKEAKKKLCKEKVISKQTNPKRHRKTERFQDERNQKKEQGAESLNNKKML